jgi:GR25 family glycosyltransferase involved in LPS biosynthesis
MNNFVLDMPVFVINCKKDKTRYDKFKKFAKKAKVKAQRVECVNGRKITDEQICEWVKNGYVAENCELTKIQIAINLSHYKCWEKIANSNSDYGLIIEDDAELYPDFVKNLNSILLGLQMNKIDFSILNLWNGNWDRTQGYQTKVLHVNKNLQVMKENTAYNAGAVAYIVTKKFAKFLMEKDIPIETANDAFVGHFWRKGNHLSLKMHIKKTYEDYEYIGPTVCRYSPLLYLECVPGDFYFKGTTQDPDAYNFVSKIKC